MLNRHETNVLGKYERGQIVDSDDESMLKEFSSIGFVNLGFRLDDNDQIQRTASLTERGTSFVEGAKPKGLLERLFRWIADIGGI